MEESTDNEIYFRLKAKKHPKFKAGPELLDKVYLDIIKEETDEAEVIEIRVKVKRFKAGPELAHTPK